VGRWVLQHAQSRPELVTYELVDLAEVGLPLLNEPMPASSAEYIHDHSVRWSRTVTALDAFVFVTPEYNRSPPAGFRCKARVSSRTMGLSMTYRARSGQLAPTRELVPILSHEGCWVGAQSGGPRQKTGPSGHRRTGSTLRRISETINKEGRGVDPNEEPMSGLTQDAMQVGLDLRLVSDHRDGRNGSGLRALVDDHPVPLSLHRLGIVADRDVVRS